MDLELAGPASVGDVLSVLSKHEIVVEGMESERNGDLQEVTFRLVVPPGTDIDAALDEIKQLDGVQDLDLRGWGSPSSLTLRRGRD